MTERRVRSLYDEPTPDMASTRPTGERPHEVLCDACGAPFFVDDATYARIERAVDFDPTDSAFVCDDCEAERNQDERQAP
jgi:hypothetical protein